MYMLIHYKFHNQHVALWLLLFAFLTFMVSAGLAYLYQITIQKVSYRAAEHLCDSAREYVLRKNKKDEPLFKDE